MTPCNIEPIIPYNQQLKVILNQRYRTEEITGVGKDGTHSSADDVIGGKMPIDMRPIPAIETAQRF